MRVRTTAFGLAAVTGLLVGSQAAVAQVMPEVLGTEESAQKWMQRSKDYVSENGIDALIQAVGEKGNKFHEARNTIAVHRINDEGRVFVERHSDYDSLVDVDMTDQQDLNGKYFMQAFRADVQDEGGGVTELELQIGKTGEVKKSWCVNEWAPDLEGEYFITVCY